MKKYLFLLFFLSYSTFAIDLVIGGKTYYIKKFQIEDDGQKIIIPYTIHLSEEAFASGSDTCEKPKQQQSPQGSFSGNTQRKAIRTYPAYGNARAPAAISEGGAAIDEPPPPRKKPRKSHPFKQLMNDLDGQFNKLTNDLKINNKKGTYKRNFR